MIVTMTLHGLDLNGVAGLITAVGAAIGGIIVSTSGLMGKRNATRREDLRECEQDRDDLQQEVLLLEWWAFQLGKQVVEAGVVPIPRPAFAPRRIEGAS